MPEVGIVGEGADDLVSPVLADVIAVGLEWWVFVAFAAALFVVLEFMIDARAVWDLDFSFFDVIFERTCGS